jgi:hypothetical protein
MILLQSKNDQHRDKQREKKEGEQKHQPVSQM